MESQRLQKTAGPRNEEPVAISEPPLRAEAEQFNSVTS